jgi:cysteine desulfurase
MGVYLDWNATTPPLGEVLDAMRAAAEGAWGNPSSVHAHGRAARALVEDARAAVAALCEVDPRDVVLTSGGTEANNLALRSSFGALGDAPPALVTSRLEHPSITRVAEALEASGAARVRWLRVSPEGVVDLADLARALGEAPVALVTIQAVNHETGVVQPVSEVIAAARACGARVHVDAVQGWGKMDVPTGWDTATLAAHKMRGPKGIGALATRPGLRVLPVLLGGAQEKGVRPGTVDPALAAGLGASARRASFRRNQHARLAEKRDRLEAGLVALGAQITGHRARRLPHVSNVRFARWVGAELVSALDLEGVSISSGSACSAGTVEPSPVLGAMLGDEEARRGVRVSLGEDTTDADVDLALAAFARVLARAR